MDTSREENKQQGNNKWDKVETILFRGCTSRYKVPEILDAVANLLRYKGIEYVTMGNETCCGGLLFNLVIRLLDWKWSGIILRNLKQQGLKG